MHRGEGILPSSCLSDACMFSKEIQKSNVKHSCKDTVRWQKRKACHNAVCAHRITPNNHASHLTAGNESLNVLICLELLFEFTQRSSLYEYCVWLACCDIHEGTSVGC